MNMLFPSTKQRPRLNARCTTQSALFGLQLELNLCANSCAPSDRKFSSGLFSQNQSEKKPIRKALSLADFASQLANT
jgi:hypothetical protein